MWLTNRYLSVLGHCWSVANLGAVVELRMREETEDRGAVGADGCGRGVSLPTGFAPLPGTFLNFVSGNSVFGAFWGIFKNLYSYVCVPISYPQGRFAMA